MHRRLACAEQGTSATAARADAAAAAGGVPAPAVSEAPQDLMWCQAASTAVQRYSTHAAEAAVRPAAAAREPRGGGSGADRGSGDGTAASAAGGLLLGARRSRPPGAGTGGRPPAAGVWAAAGNATEMAAATNNDPAAPGAAHRQLRLVQQPRNHARRRGGIHKLAGHETVIPALDSQRHRRRRTSGLPLRPRS